MKRPIRPAPSQYLGPREKIVVLFAGGGGSCTGIAQALGRPIDVAVNHSPAAIAMHTANHPSTTHHCESVWTVDPKTAVGGGKVGLLWASPDCKHFSRAKGGKPREKSVRSLAHVVVEWARDVQPRIIMLENVREFEGWGPLDSDDMPIKARTGETFREWVGRLELLGYRVEWRTLVAADYGAPTTRERLYLIARCDGLPIVWPEPTHGAGRALPWRTAAECIDWTIPCPSIFERAKPLAEATLRRIARGIQRYVIAAARPFIVPLCHTTSGPRAHSGDAPLPTITTAKGGEFAVCAPYIATMRGTAPDQIAASAHQLTEPLRTISAGGIHHALVAPALIQTSYGEREGQAPRVLDLHKPLGTVVAGGQKHGLVAAFLARHYGGNENDGAALTRPMHTVTCQDHHALVTAPLVAPGDHRDEVRAFLVKYYGTSSAASLREPLDTVTTRDRFGLVTIDGCDYAIADIGMRMLQPHELFAAQGFPPDYQLDVDLAGKRLTKTQLIELVGNSVCPPVARALVEANVSRLGAVAA
jgi:DNA (cytosine-5)-methyltransferase 1